MDKWKRLTLITFILGLCGCSEPYTANVHFTNGSTTGEHGVMSMVITTVSGGQANFAMGAVSGYPGAHATGGRMDAPAYIEGYWAKGWEYPFESYHRISMAIPEDAEQKMKTLDGYYKNFDRGYGFMQVIVDGPRVRVFYSKSCVDMYHDCTSKKGADPHGWVVRSPKNNTDVVVLFDGVGESSRTPFPDTHFSDLEKRKKAEQ